MIKVDNIEVFGWESAVRGMRNPLNSWSKSDSTYESKADNENSCIKITYHIGSNDLNLM